MKRKSIIVAYCLFNITLLTAQLPNIRMSLRDSIDNWSLIPKGHLMFTEIPFKGYYIRVYTSPMANDSQELDIAQYIDSIPYGYDFRNSFLRDTLTNKEYSLTYGSNGLFEIDNINQIENSATDSLYLLSEYQIPNPHLSLLGKNLHYGGEIYLNEIKDTLIIAFKLEGTISIVSSSSSVLLYAAYYYLCDSGLFRETDLDALKHHWSLPMVIINRIKSISHGVPSEYRQYKYLPKLKFLEYGNFRRF